MRGTIPKLITAISLATILAGCGIQTSQVTSKEHKGRRVDIYDVQRGVMNFPAINGTLMEVYNGNRLEAVLYDNGSGKLGDEEEDYIQAFERGELVQWSPEAYINAEGKRIDYNSAIGKRWKLKVGPIFDKGNEFFQGVLYSIPETEPTGNNQNYQPRRQNLPYTRNAVATE
jgi:hypothetical protein